MQQQLSQHAGICTLAQVCRAGTHTQAQCLTNGVSTSTFRPAAKWLTKPCSTYQPPLHKAFALRKCRMVRSLHCQLGCWTGTCLQTHNSLSRMPFARLSKPVYNRCCYVPMLHIPCHVPQCATTQKTCASPQHAISQYQPGQKFNGLRVTPTTHPPPHR